MSDSQPSLAAGSDVSKMSRVSHIAIVMLPETGAFNATFKLAKGLTRRGHRVIYLGPPDFAEQVTRQGFDYFSLERPERPTEQRRLSVWQKLVHRYRAAEQYSQSVASASEAALKAIEPDLVLLDPLMWRYAAPLYRLGLEIVGLNTTLASVEDWSKPPVFSSLVPRVPNTVWSRARNGVAWLKLKLKLKPAAALAALERILAYLILGSARARRLNPKTAIEIHGGALAWGEYGWRLVVPELVLAPKAFDFSGGARTASRGYVGACVDRGRDDGEFDWHAIERDRPLIYCSLGTYSSSYPSSARLFRSVVDAVARRPDCQAIVQVGDVMTVDAFGSLPDRILIVKQAPQLTILAHADIFITHGGFSSVREACLRGVPMIVFPCWLDQPGNAARVLFHGIGVRGDIKTATSEIVYRLIDQVRTAEIRDAMRNMSRLFQDEEECEAGLDWIDDFLAAHGRAKAEHRSARAIGRVL